MEHKRGGQKLEFQNVKTRKKWEKKTLVQRQLQLPYLEGFLSTTFPGVSPKRALGVRRCGAVESVILTASRKRRSRTAFHVLAEVLCFEDESGKTINTKALNLKQD